MKLSKHGIAIAGTITPVIVLILFFVSGLFRDIPFMIANEIIPEHTEEKQIDNIKDITFEKKASFFDTSKIAFSTEEGTLIYPRNNVTFKKTDNNMTSIVIYTFDNGDNEVIVYVQESDIPNVQTGFANMFGENIKWKE